MKKNMNWEIIIKKKIIIFVIILLVYTMCYLFSKCIIMTAMNTIKISYLKFETDPIIMLSKSK